MNGGDFDEIHNPATNKNKNKKTGTKTKSQKPKIGLVSAFTGVFAATKKLLVGHYHTFVWAIITVTVVLFLWQFHFLKKRFRFKLATFPGVTEIQTD